MLIDYFVFSIKGLRRRKLRSWLTLIGIFIGIAAVVALVSLSQGMQNAINEQFKKIGANRIIISPGGIFFGPMGSELSVEQLAEHDINLINKVNGVKQAIGVLAKTAKIEFKDEVKYISVMGMPIDTESKKMWEEVGFFDIKEGRQIRGGDKYKANIGYNIAYEMFDKDIRNGDKIKVEEQVFEVVGVQKKAGTGVHDIIMRIPIDTARDLFNEPDDISTIFTTAKKGFKPGDVAEDIKKAMRKDRNLKKGDEDFSVQTSEQLIARFNIIMDVVQVVLVGIAAISLLVGGIGIMNTMYTSVLERRREIGIMKAIGARNSDILLIFLLESGVLGLIGGAIGIVLGIGIAKLGEIIAFSMGASVLKAQISFVLVTGALLFSFFIGSISGVFPAMQASKLNPVDALRKK